MLFLLLYGVWYTLYLTTVTRVYLRIGYIYTGYTEITQCYVNKPWDSSEAITLKGWLHKVKEQSTTYWKKP